VHESLAISQFVFLHFLPLGGGEPVEVEAGDEFGGHVGGGAGGFDGEGGGFFCGVAGGFDDGG